MLLSDYVKLLRSLETKHPENVPIILSSKDFWKDDDRKKDDDKKKDSLCKLGCLHEGPCPSIQLDSESCGVRKF